MSGYDELKRLAWDQWDGDYWPSAEGGYFDVRSSDSGRNDSDGREFDYLAACKPSVIHGLIEEVEQLKAENEALKSAALKVIEMNRQHAEDQYGDPGKAESWSCVTVLREALSGGKAIER